ncbi:MAG: hypothetical protein ACK5MV_10840 [Aminipila sp.]
MGSSKKNNKQKIQIGSSSLLLIFTILCLVVFSTLSISSAKADYKLALKYEKSINNYYEADNQGEELKRQVNNELIRQYLSSKNDVEFYNNLSRQFKDAFNIDNKVITYTIEAGKEQFLLVELKVHNFENIKENKQNFDVTTWVIQNKVDYEIDQSMNVWNGV